jgi:disulfide oxidoreductase YuzD
MFSFAQTIDKDVLSSCGSTFESGNVNLSFTIGETMVETYQQGNLALNQGFHQSSFTFTDISSIDNKVVDITLFPNPAVDVVKVRCEEEGYMYRLIDLDGKIIFDGFITGTITEIRLDKICEGQFFMEVYSVHDRFRKTFKVIKQ